MVDLEGHIRHFETQLIEVVFSNIKASLMGMIAMSDEMSDGRWTRQPCTGIRLGSSCRAITILNLRYSISFR